MNIETENFADFLVTLAIWDSGNFARAPSMPYSASVYSGTFQVENLGISSFP